MGIDVSFLLVPKSIPGSTLLEASRIEASDGDPLHLLVGDETSAPKPLVAALPQLTVISLWCPTPLQATPWDQVGLALSRELPDMPVLAVTMSDHGCIGCWQLLKNGEPGPAHWLEHDYSAGVFEGLEAGYEVTLERDDAFFAEAVCTGMARGWRFPGPTLLDAAGLRAALAGCCCPLEHPGEQIEIQPETRPLPRIKATSDADRELVQSLLDLKLTSPAKRMFVQDLQLRVFVQGAALTDGQRERALRLLTG